jgi:structure-specific recognition protein 1
MQVIPFDAHVHVTKIYCFFPQDHDKIAGLFKQHFGVALETKDVTFKGWNWGQTDFQG